jgi:hypothetical protein
MRAAQDVINRVRAEYLEMPGMRLTNRQVQRLCGIDAAVCKDVLETMVETNFLSIKPDGTYVRATQGLPRAKPAKVFGRPDARIAAAS